MEITLQSNSHWIAGLLPNTTTYNHQGHVGFCVFPSNNQENHEPSIN